MNTEEKAKTYDEALEKAKVHINIKGIGDTVDLCKHLFPELKESEDEKLYKRIEQLIRLNTSGAEKTHLLAYLEKHKECVADSSKTSANEDESIRKFLVDYFTSYKIGNVATKLNGVRIDDILNYLEKQKEQKHPNGCFTCDEYKKGYEEGRRNGFTAGYNKAMKEVEQKEQKPAQSEEEKEYVRTLKGLVSDFIRDSGGGITDVEYYQNICDWLDGRHIEQKSNIELIQKSWYMEGYHDKEFNCEPKWIIKTGEGGPKYELNPRYGQPLAKEQKEIPLMNGDADLFFDEWNQQHSNSTKRECFEAGVLYAVRLLTEDSPMLEEFKKGLEQVILWGKEGYKVSPDGTTKSLTLDEIDEVLDELYRNATEMVEQRPMEHLSKDKVYAIMNKLTELSTSELIPLNSDEYKKINEITSDVRSLLDYPIEQKPVVTHGETYHVDTLGTQQVIAGKMPTDKPAEWSEEDERMLLSIIRDFAQGHKSSIGQEQWLKSLRPVSKESLQSHWKPSEEQMEALKNSAYGTYQNGDGPALRELYNDLKKL